MRATIITSILAMLVYLYCAQHARIEPCFEDGSGTCVVIRLASVTAPHYRAHRSDECGD